MNDLIKDDFEKWLNEEIEYPDHRFTVGMSPLETLKFVRKKYLSRHEKDTEPLAVLADRKGFRVQSFRVVLGWTICLNDRKNTTAEKFREHTYALTEAKARQYLNGLPDIKGETK